MNEHTRAELGAFGEHGFQAHAAPDLLGFIHNEIEGDGPIQGGLAVGGIEDVVDYAGCQACAFTSHFARRQAQHDPGTFFRPGAHVHKAGLVHGRKQPGRHL